MATPIPRNRAAFTLPELVSAVGARAVREGAPAASSVVTDSRAVAPGDAFVALVGERFDGHVHARAAVEAGASVVVVSRDVDLPAGPSVVRVDDTLAALGRLARAHRRRWARHAEPFPRCVEHREERVRRVVGITGSAGKTTTRLALQHTLQALGLSVHASSGNLNNAIGVPMSVLGLEEEHEVLVAEIGMNSPGEIAHGAGVAEPDVGIVTLVAAAHTEGVGDVWGVLREKSALLAALGPSGTAVCQGDDDMTRAALLASPARRALVFGAREGSDVRILERTALPSGGSDLVLLVPTGHGGSPVRVETRIALVGRAGALAAAAAAAGALAVDPGRALSDGALAAALASIPAAEPGRLAPIRRGDGAVVIDDAYNANPASMIASIEAAAELAATSGARLVLVLGAMKELGALSDALHAEVGRVAGGAGAAEIVVVDPLARPLADAALAELTARLAPPSVALVGGAGEALELARRLVGPGDVVLVKGSHSVGLSHVAASLARG